MTESPDTRQSLILRLKDGHDQLAWAEFLEIYHPLVYRLACAKGLQHADAEDVVQQVFTSVSGSLDRWRPDAARARFRTWLTTIARNATLNALARRPADRGTGDSSACDLLVQRPSDAPDSQLLLLESRREIFQWAARRVREQFEPATWDAFWLTAVEGRGVEEVARLMGKKSGAIYAARSRVMRRLKEVVAEWDDHADE